MSDEPIKDATDEPDKPEIDRADALKAEIEALKASNKEAEERNQRLFEQVHTLGGQLSVLSAAAAGDASNEGREEPPDLINDPDKALDYHFQKRTGPLLQQQFAREAKREEDLLAMRRPDEWKEYGQKVKDMIKQNRITAETLAQPGNLENVLNYIKAQDVDNIVTKKVAAEVAKFQADAAKVATGGVETQSGTVSKPKEHIPLSPEQKAIAKKFEMTEKEYVEASENVVFDGHRYIGPVN